MASDRYRKLRIPLYSLPVFALFWTLSVAWIYSGWNQERTIRSLEAEGRYFTYADIEWWNLYRRFSVACLGNEGGNVVQGIRLSGHRFKSVEDCVAFFQAIEKMPSIRTISIATSGQVVFPKKLRLPNLRSFHIRATQVDFSSAANGVWDFPRIEHISFVYTRSTDEVFSKFSNLTNLKSLSLVGRGFSGEFLKDASFRNLLVSLSIEDSDFNEEFIGLLSDYKNLTSLCLMGSRVSDKSIPAIKQLSKLKILELADTRISFSGIVELGGLDRLEVLAFGTVLDDELKDSIRLDQNFPKFPHLRVLSVDVCSLDATLIAKLSHYKNLNHLSLHFDEIATDAQSKLQAFFDETGAEREERRINLRGTSQINDLFERFKNAL